MNKFESLLGGTIVLFISLITIGAAWTLREVLPKIVEILTFGSVWNCLVKSSWYTCELFPKLLELIFTVKSLILIRVEVVLWTSAEVPIDEAFSEANTVIVIERCACLLEIKGLVC